MIDHKKLEVYEERLYCDRCGCEMECSNMAGMTCPPTYFYSCPKCGEKVESKTLYPAIVYR